MGKDEQDGSSEEALQRQVKNLYVHFPFCRGKCAYCALYSRAGATASARADYVANLCAAFRRGVVARETSFSTVYFGGGSPALCDLKPLFAALKPYLDVGTEFTVELHPLDVTESLLAELLAGGVTRVSMGVQSLDDAVLRSMGRGYTADDAARRFALLREHFPNAGIDLIVGWPQDKTEESHHFKHLADWGLRHCSVYSLILEPNTHLARQVASGHLVLPTDDAVLDGVRRVAAKLASVGLERYEISNYAARGRECRHNLAVWRGEDYWGLGEGAYGRLGRLRTPSGERLSAEEDRKERTLFRLRTREGLDTSAYPEWRPALDRNVDAGLLTRRGTIYYLTPRGTEVCDAILEEIV